MPTQGTLEHKHSRSGDSRKRRHVATDDSHAAVAGSGGGEGVDRAGEEELEKGTDERWGHDKFEEQYGEHRHKKGSKKRNL